MRAMTDADRPAQRIDHARLDWRGGAPHSAAFGDIYFSGDGAGESAHIFLAGNDLEPRLARARRFAVGELGFGSGLNFLMTWALFRRVAPKGARLHFLSVEAFPLHPNDMARAHAAWPDLAPLAARLRSLAPPAVAGAHALALDEATTLTLLYGEAGAMLARTEGGVDAWFFDGFSPAKNPEMWREALFAEAARLSNPGATFATFTVAGAVRRALASAGFTVEKRPGHGRKKEMLAGRIDAPPRARLRAPWFETATERRLAPGARLAIVGGGIAGASLAHAARRVGLDATVIENDAPAAGASGNPAGLVMPRLDLGDGAAARLFLACYLHTIRLLNDFNDPALFNACGVLLGAGDDAERMRGVKLLAEAKLPPDWMTAHERGLFFPQAGVVDPARFVAALIGDAPVVRARAAGIARAENGLAVDTDAGRLGGFDAVALANGVEALRFLEARALPLAAVAGQIDRFPGAEAPPHALAFGPYAAPAPTGGLVIGATYDRLPHGVAPAPSRAATEANIAAVAAFAPDLAARLSAGASTPRASLRCQTPDRLPVVGPLPDLAFYGGEYDGLRTGAAHAYPPARTLPGAHILAGLGSRGLVTAPLLAGMLVAGMTGAPSPVDHEIAEALHPARFFIRDLRRSQTIRKG